MKDTDTDTEFIGDLQINSRNGIVVSVEFIDTKTETDTDMNTNTYLELDPNKYTFELKGTEFQIAVWNEILKIPRGTTMTYSEIATSIGRPNSYRAVANACGQNNLTILVPCHRVVGKNNLGGYKWGIERKKKLLDFEKSLR